MKRILPLAVLMLLPTPLFGEPTSRPLAQILVNLEDAGIEQAKEIAAQQAKQQWMIDRGPNYKSSPAAENNNPAVLTDEVVFEGIFCPASESTRVAIFSDDGCDVFIDDRLVLNNFKKGQHLPSLKESFVVINFDWKRGRDYRVKVHYSNTIFTGKADIDGCTLFTFDGGGSAKIPQITVRALETSIHEFRTQPTVYIVERSGDGNLSDLRVFFSTSGSATRDVDYFSFGESVVIPRNSNSAMLILQPNIADSQGGEGPETVTVQLSTNPYYRVGAPSSATITIVQTQELEPRRIGGVPKSIASDFAIVQLGDSTSVLAVLQRQTQKEKDAETIARIWKKYEERKVFSSKDKQQLHYYKNWSNTFYKAKELLEKHDGQCSAWAKLFIDELLAAGIKQKDGNFVVVHAKGDRGNPLTPTGFFIIDWEFKGKGTNPDKDTMAKYPYHNVMNKAGTTEPWVLDKKTNAFAYDWKSSEVVDLDGIPGQGTANPLSAFTAHVLVPIDGVYYDPSYGKTYKSVDDFEERAIAAYYKLTFWPTDKTIFMWASYKNGKGNDLTPLVQTYSGGDQEPVTVK